MWRLLLSLLAAFIPFALADVQFTSPAAGGTIPAGTVKITWSDSGDAPSISQLSTYQLFLMIGGNSDTNSLQLAPLGPTTGKFSTGNSVSGTITPTLASSLTNGFYLKMISTAKDGGTVTNYSQRFTVTGMTGTTAANIQKAVTALGGSAAAVPATINDVSNAAAADPAASAAAVPAAGEYTIPYQLQKGLTRYAPMQPVPPTKITAKDAKPLFPTSNYILAKTILPVPSIVTTLTLSQTFSVQSSVNQAAAQSHPKAEKRDMDKFLARWKD